MWSTEQENLETEFLNKMIYYSWISDMTKDLYNIRAVETRDFLKGEETLMFGNFYITRVLNSSF